MDAGALDWLAWPVIGPALGPILGPFVEFGFMRRALVGCLTLAAAAAPVGVFLLLRRMSLIGDAMAHAVLPGAAIGFLVAGLSLAAMTIGGMVAGLAVALLSGAVARATVLREDASLAAFYLISLAAGVAIVSVYGSNVDLMRVLFGSVLALDDAALLLLAGIATATFVALAAIYRPLVVECFDPQFLRTVGGAGTAAHMTFLVLVVLNLVGGFHALGTLMAVGIMMLPAAAARLWAREVWSMVLVAAAVGALSSVAGLLLSYHADMPSGPAIVLVAGGAYALSIALGTEGSLRQNLRPARHLEA